jgi:protein phosphatase
LILDYVSLTDVGRHRDHNEDAIGEPRAFAPASPSCGWLFAVADGMGGHADGEVASQLAVRTLFDTYYASSARASEAIIAATLAANAAVYDAGTAALQRTGGSGDESQRMGTTLVACAVVEGYLFGVSVGDSRAYLLRDGSLRCLTHDQTLAAEQVRRGLITDEDAKRSRFRSVLLQALGHAALVQPERFDLPLLRGDLILLCSDGLHGVVDDLTIQRHLAGGSLESRAQALVDAANANGGPDNISVVIVECA